MRNQPQAYAVIANVDIRVVAGLFRLLAHPVDEGQAATKSLKLKVRVNYSLLIRHSGREPRREAIS